MCFSFINQAISENALAQQEERPRGLLQRLGYFLAEWIFRIQRFAAVAAKSDQPVMEIGYNETVYFNVGMMDFETGEFQKVQKVQSFIFSRFMNFEVIEYPDENKYGSWKVLFNPTTIEYKEGSVLKTNVSVTLHAPTEAAHAIQSGILKLGMKVTHAYGSLWFNRDLPFPNSFFWTLYAFIGGWGRYSGTVDEGIREVEVLLKIKPYHKVKFSSVPYMFFRPDEIVSIPITVQNLGNYNDTFGFRVVTNKDDVKIADPISITLSPGEIKDTYLGVYFPPSFLDYGTRHDIKIQAYSIDQPNVTIAERTVYLETKGIYFSEMSSLGIIILIFIVLVIVLFLIFRRKHIMDNICVKPDKPWDIPEEEKYLKKLKQRDKQKYNEVLEIMEDEYKSALLWYEYYVKSIIQPKPVKKEKIKEVKKEKPKKKEKFLFKKEKKPSKKKEKEEIKIIEVPIIEKEKVLVDRKARAEKIMKEQTLLRIRRDQENQRRKLKKLSSQEGG
ncbi:MAG: hypothetical protein JSV03_14090 [Planctomycetota bacterium]|nr:MAG: hypothetical protein JSV03_14090 [Planctomycetota bacterium]